jgi:hypothetical protein
VTMITWYIETNNPIVILDAMHEWCDRCELKLHSSVTPSRHHILTTITQGFRLKMEKKLS